MDTARPVTDVPPIAHREAMALAEVAYRRFADVVAALGPDDWSRPTDCTGWTVRDLVGHVIGAMRSAASVRELASQQLTVRAHVKRHGSTQVDAMTRIQLERAGGLTTREVVEECRRLVAPATAGRRRMPGMVRRFVSVPVDQGELQERWTLGYLNDVILTRDAWLHRIDLCRAVGTEPELSPGHDGRLVADVVAEWCRRHGRPVDLMLTGPAGGHFASGSPGAGDRLALDAVEFCRIVSGRAPGTGLLATPVPF